MKFKNKILTVILFLCHSVISYNVNTNHVTILDTFPKKSRAGHTVRFWNDSYTLRYVKKCLIICLRFFFRKK